MVLTGCARDLVLDFGQGDSVRLVGMADSFDCDDPAYADVKKIEAFKLVFADGTSQRLCRRETSEPTTFQLAYGKYRDEHAIRWKVDRGFAHHRVDDGERGRVRKEAPLLVPDGAFEAKGVLEQFLALSSEVPKDIVEFVAARLREHPEYREDA